MVPRRQRDRTAHPPLHPLERGGHGHPGQQPPRRDRWAPVDVRVLGQPVRGRLQLVLPGQRGRHPGRPRVLPGPRGPGHLRPGVPRGTAHRGPVGPLPPGGRRQRPVQLPPPPAHARLLGVPHRLDGAGSHQLDLSGPLPQVPPRPAHRGHHRLAGVVLPGRRGDRRTRDPRLHLARRPRPPRQPDLGRQLQPPATRRTRPRQRQDHPGARSDVPGRGLERDQGHLGLTLGRVAPARRRRRPAQQDEHDARRRVPALRGRGRQLRPGAVLRSRSTAAQAGRAPLRRGHLQPPSRRPRLHQALRRLFGRHRTSGGAHGHPGQDDQGVDPGKGVREPQRHPPDQEDEPGAAGRAAQPAASRGRHLRPGARCRRSPLLPAAVRAPPSTST